MSNLKNIRLRSQSIKSARKITYAMQLVAASKFTKAKESFKHAKEFFQHIEQALSCSIAKEYSRGTDLPFTVVSPEAVPVFIVITSERGLCGGFNISLLRALEEYLAGHPAKDYKLIVVGRKGHNVLRKTRSHAIYKYYHNIHGQERIISEQIALDILHLARYHPISCHIHFNHLKNALIQTPASKQLWPVLMPDADNQENNHELEGPNLINLILSSYLSSLVYMALTESKAGEEGARMNAMDGATRNANTLLESLTLLLNRTRQASITKELIEVVSGAEAI